MFVEVIAEITTKITMEIIVEVAAEITIKVTTEVISRTKLEPNCNSGDL